MKRGERIKGIRELGVGIGIKELAVRVRNMCMCLAWKHTTVFKVSKASPVVQALSISSI